MARPKRKGQKTVTTIELDGRVNAALAETRRRFGSKILIIHAGVLNFLRQPDVAQLALIRRALGFLSDLEMPVVLPDGAEVSGETADSQPRAHDRARVRRAPGPPAG